jgi:hypothetical protein
MGNAGFPWNDGRSLQLEHDPANRASVFWKDQNDNGRAAVQGCGGGLTAM